MDVAKLFISSVVKLHGIPRTIVTDRDAIFLSMFWSELWKQSGTKLHKSSSYHPETDGQTEVVNRVIEQYLRCFVCTKPSSWSEQLPWAEFWYNSTYNRSIGMSPFQALCVRPPPDIVPYVNHPTTISTVDEQLQQRDVLLNELREHLAAAQNTMKQQVDKGRREEEFNPGEHLYLRLQPYRQHSAVRRASHKLSPRFYGPYEILERLGKVAYRLKLPEGSKIHPVFHVSKLRRYVGSAVKPTPKLPPLFSNGELHLVPEASLQSRQRKIHGSFIHETLIKWSGLEDMEATWENTEQIRRSFPDFHLEDKVHLAGRGIDGNQYEASGSKNLGETEHNVPSTVEQDGPRRTTRVHVPNPKFL